MKQSKWALVGLLSVLCSVMASRSSSGETFYVDPDFSSLSVQLIDEATSTVISSAQVSGSDVTTLEGTFDVTLGSGTITFNSGDISFDNQSTDMRPGTNGGNASAGTSLDPYPPDPGTEQANYGLLTTQYNDPGDPGSGIQGAGAVALRDLVAGITSSSLTVTSEQFDASQITYALTAGTLAYNLNGGDGTPFARGYFGVSNSTSNTDTDGAVFNVGGVTGIIIPIDLTLQYSLHDVDIVFSGQIAASNSAPMAPVPEPGTFVLSGIGLIGLLGASLYRRFRR